MNRNRLSAALALLLFACQSPLFSAELRSPSFAPWSIGFTPGISLPLGVDASYFEPGGGSQLEVGYRLLQLPWLHLAGEFGYDFVPISFGTSVSLLSFGLAADLTVYVTPWLGLSGSISGGYYYGLLNNGAGPRSANPYIQPGIGVAISLSPRFGLGIEAAYRSFLGLYSCFGVAGNMTFYFGGERASGTESLPPKPLAEGENADNIQIRNVVFTEIFPVFFKHYEDHPIGNAIIRNNSKQQIQEIAIDIFIKQYMDNPQRCVAPAELKPGEEKPIELNALLTEKVLEVTERTKVSAEITVSYRIGKEKHTELYVDTVRIYDRNAITWDDDRRAAAFVTEKDPTVLWFSKNVASMIDAVENHQINSNLQVAMAIHLALAEFGMSYAVDPATPYTEFSKKRMQ